MTQKKPDEPVRKAVDVNLSGEEFSRLANNFYNSRGMDSYQQRINVDADLLNYFFANVDKVKDKKKVAFVWICLNPPYWEYAKQMIEGAKRFFLPGHNVDYFLWSDMPNNKEEIIKKIKEVAQNPEQNPPQVYDQVADMVLSIHQDPKVTVFPTEPIEWPMPTLMRYHTFLQQEETLAKYDYIFYADVDLLFVDVVGDEILGDGLTASTNPMYYLDKTMFPPYEPNPNSTAYIPRPGRIVEENGKPRFQPLYYAGGFQGGRADKFLEAMRVIKKNIDKDFSQNYIAIWNEESHWNRYLFDNPPAVVLNPSYIYPDSLHNEYYIPRWGRNYQPKIVTLTKKHSLQKLTPEEQADLMKMQGRKL